MPDLEPWLNPKCRMNSLDLCVARRHILRAVREQAPRFHGTLLDIGCGFMPYRSIVFSRPSKATRYIGMDLPVNRFLQENVDLVWDGTTIPLPDNSVDCSMATEFFEHCASPQKIMGEVLRVLRPGGFLFLTVPFLFHLHETPMNIAILRFP
jgi:SAM-dependent methyltransferase